ncbi:MAG: glycosyltransferase family 2 protein [Lachnospiraceae bacterium]|nr:glycosyltransferase family 2 protein [Lachnospiraceae bacterium]
MEEERRPVLISVIIPVYNVVDLLPKCVDSIRRQTYRNLEIILVDDGSTDNSGALAEKMALEDKRIRVFHKENGGSSSARNLGISKAQGDYIGFVDSDDYIEPEMYEKLLATALEENLLMVQISRDEIDEVGNRMPDVCEPPEEPVLWECEQFMRELLLHRGDCSFCTKLVHSSLLKEERFPEGELNEDFYLLVRLLPRIPAVAILPDQDYHVFYRYGSNTRTRNKDEFPQVFTDIVINADRVYEIVKKEYPDLLPEAMRFGLFQRLDYMLHIPISLMNSKNQFYCQVKEYLRRHRKDTIKSPYLTKKNKVYLLLLGTAPKFVRSAHRMLKGKQE